MRGDDPNVDALRRCLLVFQMLGDEAGVNACLRGLAALAFDPDQPGGLLHIKATPLTPRERQVASLIATGVSNRAIGRALGISEGTARRHVSNLLGKLGLKSRSQIAGWVAEQYTPPTAD